MAGRRGVKGSGMVVGGGLPLGMLVQGSDVPSKNVRYEPKMAGLFMGTCINPELSCHQELLSAKLLFKWINFKLHHIHTHTHTRPPPTLCSSCKCVCKKKGHLM